LSSSAQNINDVKFITAMIEDIAAKVPLDKNRVYLTGAANGGMMAYRLGCETSGVFAGIAPVIGNIPEPIYSSCNPTAPIDFLSINGGADPIIPLDGGTVCENVRFGCEGGVIVSRAESVNKFAAADGCSLDPSIETLPALVNDGTWVEKLTYTGCQSGTRAISYIVQNGGHAWPPRRPQVRSGGAQTGNLDASEVIVNFFLPK
jgi:polyhydroxybutyrate depolymerase